MPLLLLCPLFICVLPIVDRFVFGLYCFFSRGATGIMFQDITTLLLDTKAFKDTIDLFVERYRDKNISVVAGTYFLQLITINC
jgi:hypothetical protein